MADTVHLDYRGRNRAGTHVIGRLAAGHSIAEFVERCYDARWQDLTVECDGLQVGAIGVNLDTGQRVWWAGELDELGGFEPDGDDQ